MREGFTLLASTAGPFIGGLLLVGPGRRHPAGGDADQRSRRRLLAALHRRAAGRVGPGPLGARALRALPRRRHDADGPALSGWSIGRLRPQASSTSSSPSSSSCARARERGRRAPRLARTCPLPTTRGRGRGPDLAAGTGLTAGTLIARASVRAPRRRLSDTDPVRVPAGAVPVYGALLGRAAVRAAHRADARAHGHRARARVHGVLRRRLSGLRAARRRQPARWSAPRSSRP